MRFKVVCISRTLAAGGEVVGSSVSRRLGYKYVDEEIIAAAAQKARVDEKAVAAVEHKEPFMKRLLDSLAVAHGIGDPLGLATGVPTQSYYHPDRPPLPMVADDYRALIRSSIQEIANQGQAVIVAHAASMALAGMEGVLRVLITAPPELRGQRIREADASKSAADAATAVSNSDRERSEYFRMFYKIKEELPTHYDLVINTEVLSPEVAVDLIVRTAEG